MRYFIVDAFTSRPFAGNPAAVVPLEHWSADEWLQNIAMEMNLSETAFVVANGADYDLRWFTPKVEVDLCGHATLATAITLADLGRLADGGSVSFATRSGILRAHRHGSKFSLDFPLTPQRRAEPPAGLLASLAVLSRYVGRTRFDYLVEVESEAVLRRLAPNFQSLARVECRGVIVTALSANPRFDFVSRFFAPAEGIDEDPVTGSAHCCLADFWSRRLGKSTMIGFQASARGGIVHVEIQGDRVLLGGEGVIVARGEFAIETHSQVKILASGFTSQ